MINKHSQKYGENDDQQCGIYEIHKMFRRKKEAGSQPGVAHVKDNRVAGKLKPYFHHKNPVAGRIAVNQVGGEYEKNSPYHNVKKYIKFFPGNK